MLSVRLRRAAKRWHRTYREARLVARALSAWSGAKANLSGATCYGCWYSSPALWLQALAGYGTR